MTCKKSTFACFIDARKAFDRINRDCLWYKLQCLGVKGKMYSALKSMYNDVTCYVKLSGTHITKPFRVLQGVKQGCKVSPSLFNIYINDLAAELDALGKGISFGNNKLSLLMYADDIVILANSEQDLQCQLDCLSLWCKKWRLELNQDKTNIVHFRNQQIRRTKTVFQCNDKALKVTDRYKYLGIWFQEYLDLSITVHEVAKSASRALGLVIAKCKAAGGVSYKCFKKIYESTVQPIILYGAGIYGMKEHKILNTIQNRACRFFLSLPPKAPNLAVNGDLGFKSVRCMLHTGAVRTWLRLKNMDRDRLAYQAFLWSLRLTTNFGKKNLEYKFRSMFIQTDHLHLCNGDTVENPKLTLRQFEQHVFQKECEVWYRELWNDKDKVNGNKLRTYRTFKSTHQVDEYVKLTLPFYKRKYFSMLRAGCLPLSIETGRYTKPPIPLEKRLCSLCDNGIIEDEYHFIMQCNLYSDIRDDLMDIAELKIKGFDELSAQNQFITLMSNCAIAFNSVIAVYKMFTRRKQFV